MTRIKIVFFVSLLATLGACGGRSSLRPLTFDGGARDGGTTDAKRDGLTTDGVRDGQRDGNQDADRRDGIFLDLARDTARTDTSLDGVRRDAAIPDTARRDALFPPDTSRPDAAKTLTSIQATPSTTSIVVGVPFSGFVITGLYSDGTTTDLTTSASFTTSNSTVVAVNGRTITGLSAGGATITVTASGRTTLVRVTVTSSPLQSISIDNVPTIIAGQSTLITATGIFADGTKQDVTAQATWSSANPGVAQVGSDPSGKGKLTGLGAGLTTITATFQSISGTAQVTVTASPLLRIDITPTQPILQRGVTRAFQATATFEDASTADITLQATWQSSDPAIASVLKSSDNVVVTALAPGVATITATLGSLQATTNVTVTSPSLLSIVVSPDTWLVNIGGTQSFTAQAIYSDTTTADITLSATWTSSAVNIVSISNANGQQGQATALATGTAQVQAALSGISGGASVTVTNSPLASIAITPNPVALILGLPAQLTATGTYQNGTTMPITAQVTWSVLDGAVASISNSVGTAGKVTGLVLGATTVTATLAGISGTAPLAVAQANLASISINPPTVSLTAGSDQAYIATGNYDNNTTVDLTNQVTWSSSNIAVAQISNATTSRGLATSLIAGNTIISASLNGITGTATMAVTAPQISSIAITPIVASIAVAGTQAFVVRAIYANGTTTTVTNQATFSSSNPAVATITTSGGGGGRPGGGGRGVATGVSAGTVTISTVYLAQTATATLTVTSPVTLVGFTITPTNPPAILVGANQGFQGNAIYSDGSTRSVTGTTNWTSDNPGVASISNGGWGGGGRGQATGIGAGTTTITATYNGFTDTSTLTVRDPKPTGLLITPATAGLRVNQTQQFTALLTLDDGTTRTVTNEASWTTSNGAVASITSGTGGRGGRGSATGIGPGTATVTATYGGFSDDATVTVTAATAKQLIVTPPVQSRTVGQTQSFVATVVFDDNTTSVVTGQSTWSSSDPEVAVVSSGGGGAGNATAIAIGTSTITAAYSGLTAAATLTVTDPSVTFVQVTPTNPTLPVSGTTSFTATAVFADNSTRNVTGQATWTSSSVAVAVVGNSGGNRGQSTALSAGTSTISATYQGMTGSSVLTVAASVLSVNIAPSPTTTVLGISVPFTATATLSNNAVINITNITSWVSSDPTTATILSAGGNAGLATPVKAGSVTITATYLGISSTATLTISPATLASIAITPTPLALASGASAQLVATGTYSDGSTRVLTDNATWLSSAPSTATVSNAAGARGLVTGLAAGTATVTAIFQGITGTVQATVGS